MVVFCLSRVCWLAEFLRRERRRINGWDVRALACVCVCGGGVRHGSGEDHHHPPPAAFKDLFTGFGTFDSTVETASLKRRR